MASRDQLANKSNSLNLDKIMHILQLDYPYLFPSFYKVDKKPQSWDPCGELGCIDKIRMKRVTPNDNQSHDTVSKWADGTEVVKKPKRKKIMGTVCHNI